MRMTEGLDATDWEGINSRMLAKIAEADRPAEFWKQQYVDAWCEQRRLGSRLAHWARLVAQSAGVEVTRNPSDEEAEAILLGWATTQALKTPALGTIPEGAA